jgi:hypothetical protein
MNKNSTTYKAFEEVDLLNKQAQEARKTNCSSSLSISKQAMTKAWQRHISMQALPADLHRILKPPFSFIMKH